MCPLRADSCSKMFVIHVERPSPGSGCSHTLDTRWALARQRQIVTGNMAPSLMVHMYLFSLMPSPADDV